MPQPLLTQGQAQTGVLLLADIAAEFRLWGWSRIVKGPSALQHLSGLVFAKVLGSGQEGGFGLRPSVSRQGLLLWFETPQQAEDFMTRSQVVKDYQERSREFCLMALKTWSSRGRWDQKSLDVTTPAPVHGPVAALTRASIKFTKARAFWQFAPASQNALSHAQGCQLAVGLGEAPYLRQATFSIWDSVADMDAYARSGAHLKAIQAAQNEGYFSESLFARFVPLQVQGQWQGKVYG